jgi:hypothetical protein
MKLINIKTIECPVWENDEMTDATEPRVLLVFSDAKTLNGLRAGKARIGSLFLHKGITQEQAEEALSYDDDYSDRVEFIEKPDSDFYKAVLK